MDSEESKKVQKKRERSAAYPACSLNTSLDDITNLKERLGKGPYSREEAAKALGYSGINGISAGRIAACVHYGLLARTGSTYSISELASRILSPTSESEKQLAIAEAFQSPALYNKLVQTYTGQALPTMLSNILSRNYGIADRAAENAARTFKESAEFAGMLHNGVITQLETSAAEATNQDSQPAINDNHPVESVASDFQASETSGQDHYKERGVNESGDGWTLKIVLRYADSLPREIRRRVNDLISDADDIVDELNGLACGVKDETAEE